MQNFNWRWYVALPYVLFIICPALLIHILIIFLLGGKNSKYGSKVDNWNPQFDFLYLNAVMNWVYPNRRKTEDDA